MVSVIIPIYNVEKYIRQCVNSVLCQTYTQIEIILVDDGSPDNCGAICDEYAERDNRIIVIHKENGGLSDARNAGMAIARGEFVYFLDSDDYLRKNEAIEELLAVCDIESSDIVFFDAETQYEDHEDPEYRENFMRSRTYNTDQGARVFLEMFQNGDFFSCVQLHFFRKSFLDRQALRFVKDMMHEDELFTVLAYLRAERVSQLRDTVYVKRLRSQSIMSERKTIKSINGLTQCIDGYLEELPKHSVNSDERRALEQYTLYMAQSIVNKYMDFNRSLRKLAKPQITHLKNQLATVDYFGKWKLKTEFRFFTAYVFYKEHIKRR